MAVLNYDQAAQIARVYGFSFYETCHCGGMLKHNYKKDGYWLELMPNKKMFNLKEQNKYGAVIFKGTFDQLEETIK
jgi:hypothetical protein